jgi:hypothetical protein
VHVLPPPVYDVQLSNVKVDPDNSHNAAIELIVSTDPDYYNDPQSSGASIPSMTITNVPAGVDCKQYNEWDYISDLGGNRKLVHWLCWNNSVPSGTYTVTFHFVDQYHTVREVPVSYRVP